MQSNWSSTSWLYRPIGSTASQLSLWPEPPAPKERKALADMTDEEATAEVAAALHFPFVCKRCANRVKEVLEGGLCPICAGWATSWGTMINSAATSYVGYRAATRTP